MAAESAPPLPSTGAWQGRPAGLPRGIPPPSVPLSFLAAASLGLVACGAALVWSRAYGIVDPTDDHVVAAVHFAMLATLSMGVLGALHQFTPVITQMPLRSERLSRATFWSWLAGAWLLPFGFATQQEFVVEAGGRSPPWPSRCLWSMFSQHCRCGAKGHRSQDCALPSADWC